MEISTQGAVQPPTREEAESELGRLHNGTAGYGQEAWDCLRRLGSDHPELALSHALDCRGCHSQVSPLIAVAQGLELCHLSQEVLLKMLDHAAQVSDPKELRDTILFPVVQLAEHLQPAERMAVIRRAIDEPIGRIRVSRKSSVKRRRSVAASEKTVAAKLAKQHCGLRLSWFYELALLTFEDGHEYRAEKRTYLQYGKGNTGNPACHSSILPSLKRRKTRVEIWERDKFEEGLFNFDAFHDMASTVQLPKVYNEVDRWLESTGNLRYLAAASITQCARGELRPDECLVKFGTDFSDAIGNAREQLVNSDQQAVLDLYDEASNWALHDASIDCFLIDWLGAHLTEDELRGFAGVYEFVEAADQKYDTAWEELSEDSRRGVQLLMADKLRAKPYDPQSDEN